MRDFSRLIFAGLLAAAVAAGLTYATPAQAQWLSRAGLAGPVGEETLDQAEIAFQKGDLERARSLAFRHDDAGALLVRAYLAEYDGDLKLATRFARAAQARALDAPLRARAAAEVGRLVRVRGDWDAAENLLRQFLAADANALPVRLELGRLLGLRGAHAEAEVVLKPFSQAFNNGKITSARQLTWLAEAMWQMGSFDDANFAFEKMYKADPGYLPGLVLWARLLLTKYNIADALRTLKEALKINPHHPGALVEMARLQMETSNYFGDAETLLAQAEAVWAENPRLLATRAELQIYDADCDLAAETADAILVKYPRNLDALIIKAACRYLLDDRAGFEALVEQALAIKPDLARLFTETARYAQMVHRYLEVVELSRRALKLRPGYPPALLSLGIGLSRIGEEREAVKYLNQAFAADPYNVRAYNMVELYDKLMPDFEFNAYEGFRLRTHRAQSGVLNQIMPDVIRAAMVAYEKKYRFKADETLDIEVFPKGETFGVRSVGLPQISPTGLCFGRIVISRSPSDGNFNWRQVIWHEMAHVYHIQKAEYRVPRWFTEGLAEYETNIKDPSWSRHLDSEIVEILRANQLPSVVELDRSFTRARSFDGILRAYQLSSLAIHFIVEEHGFEAINKMLTEFPRLLETGKVIEASLGRDVESFDREFKAWLKKRYSNFNSQFLVDLNAIDPSIVLQKKLARDPKNPVLRAKFAFARLREGDVEQAKRAIKQALAAGHKNPTVRYLAAIVEFHEGSTRDAYAHGMAILDEFKDGYPLRVMLGRAAMMLEKPTAARVHLIAAVQLYEDGVEAWVNLLKLAESQQDAELKARAEARLFALDQNDPKIARRRFEQMVARQRWAPAADAAERWVAVEPFEPRAQRALARASLGARRPGRAVQAYETLLRLTPDEKAAVLREAADSLEKAGFRPQAKSFKARAASQEPGLLLNDD